MAKDLHGNAAGGLPSGKRHHVVGFDYLRALLSLMVVGWHIQIFGGSPLFDPQRFRDHVFGFSDLLNFYFLLTAVPAFIFLSCYLYVRSSVAMDKLRRRLYRLSLLALFWAIALILWQSGYGGLGRQIPKSMGSLVKTVLVGGDTPFYFFTALVIATLFTHTIFRLERSALVAGLFLSLLPIGVLPFFTPKTGQPAFSAFWNPLNFLAMPFAAVLAMRQKERLAKHFGPLALILMAAILGSAMVGRNFYISEAFFAGQGYAMPGYTRISITLSAILLVLLFERIQAFPPGVIRFMSRYSLALYCIPPFLSSFAHAHQALGSACKLAWQQVGLATVSHFAC